MSNENVNSDANQDFNSMSMEELESFLDRAEGGHTQTAEESPEPESQTEETTEEQPEAEESEEVEADQSDEPEAEEEEKDEVENPFYKGKSKRDLVSLIEENKRHNSRRDNELYQLKKKLESLEEKKVHKLDEETEQALSEYDQDQVETMRKLVRQELIREKQESLKQTKAQREANEKENDLYWSVLQKANPDMAAEIKTHMEQEYVTKGAELTLGQRGWVESFVSNYSKSEPVASGRSEKIIKKKIKAATVKGNSSSANSSGSNKWKGKPEPSNPDDYIEWVKVNKGIAI